MKYCTYCGKELADDAAFCTRCGKSMAPTVQSPPPDQSGPPNQAYYPEAAPDSPTYHYYQSSPYSAGPNYRSGGNRAVLIILAVVLAVALLVVSAFSVMKLVRRVVSLPYTKPFSDSAVSPVPFPGFEDPEEYDEPFGGPDALAILGEEAEQNVLSACDEIGLDAWGIENFDYYTEWLNGPVYTFTYQGTVVDLLLYDSGKVFTIETSGVQIYLDGYESFYIDDYLGGTAHYDETAPTNGYIFYVGSDPADSTLHIAVADDKSYVVELVDTISGNLVTALYADSTAPLDILVPAGTYKVQFAAGSDWLSVDELFGAETAFYERQSLAVVAPDSGVSVTLDTTGINGDPAVQTDGTGF